MYRKTFIQITCGQRVSLWTTFYLSLFILLISTGIGACRHSVLSTPVQLGLVKDDLTQLLLNLNRQNDFTSHYGLKQMQWKSYDSFDQLVSAVRDGSCSGGAGPLSKILELVRTGSLEISIIAPVCLNGYGLLVPRAERHDDFTSFNGKKIGVTAQHGVERSLIEVLSRDYQLDPGLISLVSLSESSMEKDLLTGKVDALFVSEPTLSRLLENEGIRIFMLSDKILPDHPHSVLFLRSSLVNEKPEISRALIMSCFETSDWVVRRNVNLPEEARKFSSLAPELLKKAINHFRFTSRFPTATSALIISSVLEDRGSTGNKSRKEPNLFREVYFLEAQKNYLAKKQKYYTSLKKKKEK